MKTGSRPRPRRPARSKASRANGSPAAFRARLQREAKGPAPGTRAPARTQPDWLATLGRAARGRTRRTRSSSHTRDKDAPSPTRKYREAIRAECACQILLDPAPTTATTRAHPRLRAPRAPSPSASTSASWPCAGDPLGSIRGMRQQMVRAWHPGVSTCGGKLPWDEQADKRSWKLLWAGPIPQSRIPRGRLPSPDRSYRRGLRSTASPARGHRRAGGR